MGPANSRTFTDMTRLPTAVTLDLSGRIAVVTGGASGIGAACVDSLRAAGARVIVADLRPEAGQPEHLACDVTQESAVQALMQDVHARHGRLDILVNAAGVVARTEATVDHTLAQWQQVLDINVTGTWLCCREAGRLMLAQGGGSIVNIGSVAGVVGLSRTGSYSPGKAAVNHLSRTLAVEWARQGVRVNAVAPGYVDTPLLQGVRAGRPGVTEALLSRVPQGRLGTPQEIANVVLFLCSPLASFVTGSVVTVDGGWSAHGGPAM
ncbi:MAG: hypothetical protein RJA10_1721 [Pseudomonadota bacterium]